MATFPRMFSAIGRRFTTYVHSFLIFLSSGFFGRGLTNLLLQFRGQRDQGTSGLLQSGPSDSNPQSQLQRQTAVDSRDRAVLEGEENTTATNTTTTTTDTSTTATSSEAEEDHLSLQATDADDERELNDDNYIYDTDDEMSSGGKRGTLPKIIPALPLVPIPTRRKDSSSTFKAQKQQGMDLVDLSDELSAMRIGGQAAPFEQKQESATPPYLQVITNGSTPATTTNHTAPDVTGKGKGKGKSKGEAKELPTGNTFQVEAGDEVLQPKPVSIAYEVSQNGNLKENRSTNDLSLVTSIAGISTVIRAPDPEETAEQAAQRMLHSGFMRDALDMARLALKTNETPVGCVLVYKNRVIAKGMNATNITRNGTRHAELMAISALLSYTRDSDFEVKKKGPSAKGKKGNMPLGDRTNTNTSDPDESAWGDVDPRDGHIYPYGQKLHPSPRVDRSIINECVLYVTVEPCIMCASLLRQLGIKKVYFGAVNDKFGGTGGVFHIHKNSPPAAASCPPSPNPSPGPQDGKGFAKPILERRPVSTSNIPDGQGSGWGSSCCDDKSESGGEPPIDPATIPGDGGNIERGYDAEGGWGRDEAVTLLRQFYVQENGRAPVPRKKEGRAARLAAMMERDGHAGGPMIGAGTVLPNSKTGENSEESSDSAKGGDFLESPLVDAGGESS